MANTLDTLTPRGPLAATDVLPILPMGGATALSTTPRDIQNFVLTSVKQFGAQCDGETDDAAANIAALATFVDYQGGELVVPANTAIGSTLTIANKKGWTLTGQNGQGFDFVGATYGPSLKWIGAAGGTVLALTDPLDVSLRNLAISGEDVADYGMVLTGATSGWGRSNFEHLAIYGANKNAVLKTGANGDYGRGYWLRDTFRKDAVPTGNPLNDAIFVFNNDSSIIERFYQCEWVQATAGSPIAGSLGLYIAAGSPLIDITDSYTNTGTGISAAAAGAQPRFRIDRPYSEDINFLHLPNTNTRQVVREALHAQGGGVSVAWDGGSSDGVAFIVDGGYFAGSLNFVNDRALVVLNNAPQFMGGYPTFSQPYGIIEIGRGSGPTYAATETHGAIGADAFVERVAPANTTATFLVPLQKGSVFPGTLVANTTVAAPATIDQYGRDGGRVIEIQLMGGASAWTVTLNAIFLKAGRAYAHSGIGKLDILRFRWNGTNWLEISRSMNVS